MPNTLKLSRNLVFAEDNTIFYDDTNAVLGNSEIVTAGPSDIYISDWNIPIGSYIASNIDILSESEYFGDLSDKKVQFKRLFQSLPSLETSLNLSKNMSSIVQSMVLALKTADKLYWLDKNARIRSEFTLDYCLTQGAKLAQNNLKILNIISETELPKEISKVHIENDFADVILKRKQQMGSDVVDTLDKQSKKPKISKPRKSKKIKMNATEN